MQKKRTIGFMFKQINNVYEKEFNNRLRTLGITASQCAVLDYLFDCEKEEVTQRDIEKGLNLRNPTVTGLLKRLDEKGYILSVPSNTDKRCKNIYLTEKAYDIQRRMENQRRKLDKTTYFFLNLQDCITVKWFFQPYETLKIIKFAPKNFLYCQISNVNRIFAIRFRYLLITK